MSRVYAKGNLMAKRYEKCTAIAECDSSHSGVSSTAYSCGILVP